MKMPMLDRAIGSLLPAVLVACICPGVASAEETKVLIDNDKVRVLEVRFRPGEDGPGVERPYRVVRPLTDGTLQRTHSDGRVEIVEWKAGQVKEVGPDNFVPKNIGKSELVLFVVVPK